MRTFAAVSVALCVTAPAFAARDALEIVKRAEAHYRGFGGQRSVVRMKLEDPSGASKVYEFAHLALETKSGARMLIRFKKPGTHAGTGLLVREVPRGEDEVWLFLSQTHHLKRVSGTGLHASFLGSEMDIEQFTFPKTADYTHRLLSATESPSTDGARPCHWIEQTPRAHSRYGKVLTCIDTKNFATLETRYFDRSGVPLRVLTLSDHSEGKKRRAKRLHMKNVRNGRATVLEVVQYKPNIRLSESLFEVSQLARQ